MWSTRGAGTYACLRWEAGCGVACSADDATCDGVDDDCDGALDEHFAPVPSACGTGNCAATGFIRCVGGAEVDDCTPGTPAPNDASCDALDDDCDGIADEDFAPVPTSCGVGACTASGSTVCTGGVEGDTCAPGTPAPTDATCNGVDDDCDAVVDEDYVAPLSSCGVGACAATGLLACLAGTVVDTCVPGAPAPDDSTCDGVDDDCDGLTDDECPTARPTCVDLQKTCGLVADGFVALLDCGTCELPETCGGGGEPNVCGVDVLPPDPATVAPSAPNGVTSGLLESLSFFFDPANPIQIGADPAAFEAHRAGAMRGRVLNRAGDPLAGVRVQMADHPEYGFTFTRSDGFFDLVVNGGGNLIVDFAQDNYLPVQRRVRLQWDAYAVLPDVVLTTRSPAFDDVAFGSTETQTAIGPVEADADGTRQAVLMIPAGTTAVAEVGGTSVPLANARLRITEYTVGGAGPAAMPFELPNATMYTYAVDVTVDGVDPRDRVRFNRPLSLYLENFLDLPTGTIVPAGTYDFEAQGWIPDSDGVVLRIVAETAGLADIDIDDDPEADPPTELVAFGITDEDRRLLAALYDPGASLWRVPREHLSPCDVNLLGRRRLPPDPGVPDAVDPISPESQCEVAGSSIRCQSQSLAERIPIAGTAHILRYQSDRVAGNTVDDRTLKIDLNGYSPLPDTENVRVRVEVLGRTVLDTEVPSSTDPLLVTWDGLDAFDRIWYRPVTASYTFEAVNPWDYVFRGGVVRVGGSFGSLGEPCSFGDPCCVAISDISRRGIRVTATDTELITRETYTKSIGRFSVEPLGLGGFFPEDYHVYLPDTEELLRGTGDELRLSAVARSRVVAGEESDNNSTTVPAAGPARSADIFQPLHLAVGPSGTVYFAQGFEPTSIWSVTPDHQLVPILVSAVVTPQAWAAWAAQPTFGGGAPMVRALEVDSEERLYFLDDSTVTDGKRRVFRLTRTGSGWGVERLVGTPTNNPLDQPQWFDGDPLDRSGGLIRDIALRSDDTLLLIFQGIVGDITWKVVERLPDGRGRTRHVSATELHELARGPDNSIYVTEQFFVRHRIRQILSDDSTRVVLGDGTLHFPPWDQPARDAQLSQASVRDMTTATDGSLYFGLRFPETGGGPVSQFYLARISNGMLERVSFGGLPALNFNIGVARLRPSEFGGQVRSVAASPDGTIYLTEEATNRIVQLRVGSTPELAQGYRVSSPDGHEVYFFDAAGRHLRTVDSVSGVTLRSFAHDAQGRLESIVSPDGQVTRFDRPDAGRVIIRAPDGPGGLHAITTLFLNADGYVDSITDPEGAAWAFDYDPGGLLRRMWRPRSNVHGLRTGPPSRFDYERFGGPTGHARLIRDEDPAGGVQALSLEHDPAPAVPITATWCDGSSYTVGWEHRSVTSTVARTTAAGPTVAYATSRASSDAPISASVTSPAGRTTSWTERNEVNVSTFTWPGGSSTTHIASDPLLGGDARFPDRVAVHVDATPGRAAMDQVATHQRTVIAGPDSGLELPEVTSWSQTTSVSSPTTTTRTARVDWDGVSRTMRTISPEGRIGEVVLDTAGRVTEARLPGQVPTLFSYDGDGRLLSIRRAAGAAERRVNYAYDAVGYVSGVTTPTSSVDQLEVRYPDNDLRGLPREVEVVGAGTVALRRDIEGFVEGVTPPDQPEHVFDYSPVALPTEYRPPGVVESPTPGACPPGATCVVYDVGRRVETLVRPDGQTVTPSYHPTSGLVTSVDVTGEGAWGLFYDTVGRLTRASAPDGGELRYEWQSDLLIATEQLGTHAVTDGTGAAVWSGTLDARVDAFYSNDLWLDRLAVRDGHAVRYGYDRDGLVASVTPDDPVTTLGLGIGRSPLDGHLETTSLGIVDTEERVDVSTATPGFGDWLGQTVRVGGTVVYDSHYSHDRAGRIVEQRETVEGATRTRRYEYDAAGRLHIVRDGAGVIVGEYRYDPQGNRTYAQVGAGATPLELGTTIGCDVGVGGLTKAANFQDQLCRYGDDEYTYDGNGRLSAKRSISTGAVTRYRYGGDGRLLDVELPDGRRVSYVHDAEGRRIGRVVDGVLERGWIYKDGINPVAQLDASGAVEATFVYATRAHVPDYVVRVDGSVFRFVTDHLGSVRLVVNAETGVVAERIEYDEWGNVVASSGAWSVQPFGYAGGLQDPDTGLVRFGARDYEPGTGRWTAKDPGGLGASGPNLYGYAGNDPINHFDPTGFDWLWDTLNWLEDNATVGIEDVIPLLANDERGGSKIGKVATLGNTILGAVLGGASMLVTDTKCAGFAANAVEFTNVPWLGNDLIATPAITIGNVSLYAAASPGAGVQAHERQHTYQAEAMGPVYLPAHLGLQLFSNYLQSNLHPSSSESQWHEYNPLEWGPNSSPPTPWRFSQP